MSVLYRHTTEPGTEAELTRLLPEPPPAAAVEQDTISNSSWAMAVTVASRMWDVRKNASEVLVRPSSGVGRLDPLDGVRALAWYACE